MGSVFLYGDESMYDFTENISNREDVADDALDGDRSIQVTDKNSIEIDNLQATAPTLFETVEMVDNLPDDFLDAYPIIQSDIFPVIANLGKGRQTYFKDLLVDKLKVRIRVINESLKEFIQEREKNLVANDNPDLEEEEVFEPEIIERAEQLALDPLIFKRRIDMVNNLGIINERRNIGMISMTMDSRLNRIRGEGSGVLALKITGIQGSGKSASVMAVKKLYPHKCYHYLNSGSAKSIYNMGKDALQNKVLILGEAFSFQQNNSNDSEFAHTVRCLVSDGFLSYQYTSYDNEGNKITLTQIVRGPTPLITTSIYGSLEQQLDDRMFSVHPDISSKQTKEIILNRAQLKLDLAEEDFENSIQTWRALHESLNVCEVYIPFRPELSIFVTKDGELPVSARRAFERVITSIDTITLLHQKQREKDDMGRLIAEIQDYAIAYQLIEPSFRESLGGGMYTDRRIQLIDKIGPVAPRDLAKSEGVSGSAITDWSKNWLEKGIVIWTDDQGLRIKKKDQKKMKHSGKAFLKVVGLNRLPTPFELTGDDRWDVSGELYEMYDLKLESAEDVIGVNPCDQDDLNSDSDSEPVDNGGDDDDGGSGVKELKVRTQEEVKELVRESIRKQREEYVPDDAETKKLDEEFKAILKPYDPEKMKQRARKRLNNHNVDDVLEEISQA